MPDQPEVTTLPLPDPTPGHRPAELTAPGLQATASHTPQLTAAAASAPQIDRTYQDRIIGYDHPTSSVSPQDNAAAFLEMIPPDVTLELDIICHSRGGLVARLPDNASIRSPSRRSSSWEHPTAAPPSSRRVTGTR